MNKNNALIVVYIIKDKYIEILYKIFYNIVYVFVYGLL